MARKRTLAEITAMTDDELIAACRYLPWERRLDSFGCLWFCIVPAGLCSVLGYELIRLGWFTSIGGTIAFVIVASYILVLQVSALTGFRARHYVAELARRYGQGALSHYIKRVRVQFTKTHSPDWVLMLKGHQQLYGNVTFVQAELWTAQDQSSTISRCSGTPVSRLGGISEPKFEKATISMSSVQTEQLLSLCMSLKLKDWGEDPSWRTGGYPCNIVAMRKQPTGMGKGFCKVAGNGLNETGSSMLRLAEAVWDLSKSVPIQPLPNLPCDEDEPDDELSND